MKSISEILPIRAIRVISRREDWVSDIDATRTVDQLRGFSIDDWGVHLYTTDKDIHGQYDNVDVPFTNLEALVFYFNDPTVIESEEVKDG